MKKMYKKPITDNILVKGDKLMDSMTVSSGGTDQINGENGGKITGNAPKRRTRVF